MIELKKISKVYGGITAVDQLDLRIPTGSCYGLLGPNGAGKSTTLSILLGMVAPDEGEIWIDGQRQLFSSPSSRRLFGYVPQELALYEELSALDNLRFFGAIYNLASDQLERRIAAVVEVAQLQDRLKGSVRHYSGGMKRRLNLALALLHEPRILVLDEPTVGVDPQSRNLIFEALEALTAQGVTILYTTHYMEEIERLCSRVAIIDHGKLIADDTLPAVMALMPVEQLVSVQLADWPSPEKLQNFPNLAEVNEQSLTIWLKTNAQGEQMIALLHLVQRELGQLVSVNTQAPTLEQLFLHLTGRRLRD